MQEEGRDINLKKRSLASSRRQWRNEIWANQL